MQVATTGNVTNLDRKCAWGDLSEAAKEKKTRPLYRAVNDNGLMYAGRFCTVIPDEVIYV